MEVKVRVNGGAAVHGSIRLICAILTILCLICPAWADGAEEETAPRFEGKSWEEIVTDFLAERGIPESSVSLGYKNLVTGEEYYWNGDELCVGASVYKLPLNMYFAEKVFEGEMTMQTPVSGLAYEIIQRSSLVLSDNTTGEILQMQFNTYAEYRAAIAKYLGVGKLPEDDPYYKYNSFTARHMIRCLQMLYEDPERYPGVLDCIEEAAQDNYFALLETRYPIAHKHGYVPYEDHLYINDCAIVYTEQPIAVVMFSDTIPGGIWSLSAYCTLMCDYAAYRMENPLPEPVEPIPPETADPVRPETQENEEQPALPEKTENNTDTVTDAESAEKPVLDTDAAVTAEPAPETAEKENEGKSAGTLIIAGAAAAVFAVGFLLLKTAGRRKRT